ncbi:MAG: YraN family protein [Acidothermaceae bacterium]
MAPAAARGALGRYGEDVAARHLVTAGLTLLDRNWRCREGEVDIVAREGDVLVVCEVKTRRGVGFGTPLDAVTPVKAARLRRLAAHWLAEQRARAGEAGTGEPSGASGVTGFAEVRFDVVSVLRPASGPAIVEHLRGAF